MAYFNAIIERTVMLGLLMIVKISFPYHVVGHLSCFTLWCFREKNALGTLLYIMHAEPL